MTLAIDLSIAPENAIDKFNEIFAVTVVGGRVRIAEPNCFDPSLNRPYVRFVPIADFKQMFGNWRIAVPGTKNKTKLVPIAEFWLAHQMRRQHLAGVVCDPSNRARPEFLNLWQGLAVEPKPGDCDIILEHLFEVVCSGDEQCFSYAHDWLASKLQRPGEPTETAFVMRGRKGTGKGLLGHFLCGLFGSHAMFINQPEHLVGKFNTHLLNCCLLFADEAFFAGDRRHEKILNALITEPTIVIEKKGVDAFQARNRLSIIMAANADWVVPASRDERRYFVTDVSETRRGDRAYFNRLWRATSDASCRAAFLHHMLGADINGFEIRNIPRTAGLNDQKIASLDDFENWLLYHLMAGETPSTDPTLRPPFSDFWITTDVWCPND